MRGFNRENNGVLAMVLLNPNWLDNAIAFFVFCVFLKEEILVGHFQRTNSYFFSHSIFLCNRSNLKKM